MNEVTDRYESRESRAETDNHRCICCPTLRKGHDPRRPMTMPVCDGCRARVHDDLAALPAGYSVLPSRMEPGRSGSERMSTAFESRLPLALAPFDLTGPGTMTVTGLGGRQLGDPPPLTVLHWWSLDWITIRDMRETPPDPVMPVLVAWLLNRLDWAMDNHPVVDEFAGDVVGMARTIRAVSQTDSSKGESAGSCPRETGDGRRCGTKLFVDPYVDEIKCGRCGATWKRRNGEWLKLRSEQIAAVEAAA